jgi:hypothetical protein
MRNLSAGARNISMRNRWNTNRLANTASASEGTCTYVLLPIILLEMFIRECRRQVRLVDNYLL